MKEIIDAAKKISTPIIEVYLKKEYATDEIKYKGLRAKVEKTVIRFFK